MIDHEVRVARSADRLPKADQLAWKIAEVAADPVGLDDDVVEMAINRIIDNAGVAIASFRRHPVATARDAALAHPYAPGAQILGLPPRVTVSPEWAAYANGVAVRELDFHDTFLAADYAHPGDNIPPIMAVAQHMKRDGLALARGITTGYEIQVALTRGICLHEHRIDHIAHLGPSAVAGIGCLLDLDTTTIYQAIQQALHTTTTTRQSRKGEISSWKAYAPGFAGKMAIEAVDRAMRGETSPSPIYEGEDGVIAWLLAGPGSRYVVSLPAVGESKRGMLDTYTKEYSAEYQAQAFIDLARRLRQRVPDPGRIAGVTIHTSHHTHYVIGTGANDPQKMDPDATRETLDHSLMYIFAVALEDGTWHHERSYASERAHRRSTIDLWRKIATVEDPSWTERYHSADPTKRAYGGRVVVELEDGTRLEDELAVADAHPLGAHPFARADYIAKFRTLTAELVDPEEQDRFLECAERLPSLRPDDLSGLNVTCRQEFRTTPSSSGIFARPDGEWSQS